MGTKMDTYTTGLTIGCLIGFCIMYLARHGLAEGKETFTISFLGILLVAMLFLGHVIHKED